MKIFSLTARSIHDSRGTPTIEVVLETVDGTKTTASVPSGASTGHREALEKRDADGMGVAGAIQGIKKIIAPAILRREFASPRDVDHLLLQLDGTTNKENLGANAILAISIAATRAFARAEEMPMWKYIAEANRFIPKMPKLYMNTIEGGVHADLATPFQEHILVLEDTSVRNAYAHGQKLFDALGKALQARYGSLSYGDEGGYVIHTSYPEDILTLLFKVTDNRDEVSIAIDAAANEFYQDGMYFLAGEHLNRNQLTALYERFTNQFRLLSIEDPFAEDDVAGFAFLTEKIGHRALVVGDDLTVTNPRILKDVIIKKAVNALIIKPNQIGTLTEVYETVKLAHAAGWECIASHRAGETDDAFIADLAVAIGAFGLKAGAPSQKERRAKYERLIKIEQEMV
jgi:enolase